MRPIKSQSRDCNIKLMFLPQVRSPSTNLVQEAAKAQPTPSHEPFSHHKLYIAHPGLRPLTGPRGTLPFRTTRGRLAPLLMIVARPTRNSKKAVCTSPRGAERRLILSNAVRSRLLPPRIQGQRAAAAAMTLFPRELITRHFLNTFVSCRGKQIDADAPVAWKSI